MRDERGKPGRARTVAEAYYSKPMHAVFKYLELGAYDALGVEIERPALDLACGDGSFGRVLCRYRDEERLDIGADVVFERVRRAREGGAHALCVVSDASCLPLRERSVRLAVCNSALHGIPDAGGALKEVARVLVPSGRLVMTVATPSYASGLPQVRLLARLGLKGTARRYARRVNARNGHERRAWLEEWQGELAAAGLAVEGHAYYFGGRAAAVWGVLAMLPFRALALLRYAPGPVRRAAARTTEALVKLSAGRPHPVGERAGYLLIVARKPEGRG